MKRPLSKSQIVCIILLWVALCYIVLVYAERIDGPTILMPVSYTHLTLPTKLEV